MTFAAAALSFLVLPGGDDSKSPPKLGIELLLEMESVAAPKAAPDGKQVVFTRTWNDKVNDRPQGELWIMDADGSRLRQLGEGSAAEWSPDGTRLAFLKEGKPKGPQIHVMWVATRETTQVTRVDSAPSALRWSPDGTRIAFQSNVPEKGDALAIQLPKRPEGAKWAEDATVITRLAYRRDQSGYRPAGFDHLFVVDATGGTPRQVTSGDFDHGDPEWTSDGRKLLFAGLRDPEADWKVFESEIYSVDVESGEVVDLTNRKGEESSPKVSPDGKWIAFLAQPDHDVGRHSYDVTKLMVMKADGTGMRELAPKLDRDPVDCFWSRDSSGVFVSVDSAGTRRIWSCPLSGAPSERAIGEHRITLSDVAADGALWGVKTSPQRPPDIVRLRFPTDAITTTDKLTSVNDDVLSRLALAPVEELRWKSADGLEIQGWLVKPPDFAELTKDGGKIPLVLQIHGGPHSMYGVEWSFERQWLAAQGYALLYANPRGSTGYGQDFGNAIQNAYPGKDYDDLMAGVDAVLSKGFVDEKKLCVYGGSGGGVLTAWTVGHTERFAAAVSMFPVIDWISFVGTTDGPWWYANFEKLPWEDVTEHWDRSPLKYVGNVKTPTLLITGELDLRTPMAQTEEYYQALKLLKVDTAMVRVPDEYHGAAGRHPSNAMRRMLYVESWFRKHLPGAEPAKAPAATGASATSGS
jgi:dipeptidyl aminopeptidase/acylaminoacyl peptidase